MPLVHRAERISHLPLPTVPGPRLFQKMPRSQDGAPVASPPCFCSGCFSHQERFSQPLCLFPSYLPFKPPVQSCLLQEACQDHPTLCDLSCPIFSPSLRLVSNALPSAHLFSSKAPEGHGNILPTQNPTHLCPPQHFPQ